MSIINELMRANEALKGDITVAWDYFNDEKLVKTEPSLLINGSGFPIPKITPADISWTLEKAIRTIADLQERLLNKENDY